MSQLTPRLTALTDVQCRKIATGNNAPATAEVFAAIKQAFMLGANRDVMHTMHREKEPKL